MNNPVNEDLKEVYFPSKKPFVTKLFKDRLKAAIKFAGIKDDSEILDVGCAHGYLLIMIQKFHSSSKCHGIETTPDWKNRSAEKLLENCDLRVGDARKMPFADESFDIVFATDVLEHIPDYDIAINEIRRVLKTDGIAILSGPTETTFYKFCRLLYTGKWKLPSHKHAVYEIEDTFELSRFQLVDRVSLPGFPFPELFRMSKHRKISKGL